MVIYRIKVGKVNLKQWMMRMRGEGGIDGETVIESGEKWESNW